MGRKHDVIANLDAKRRVGWAKYYQRTEEVEQLQAVNAVLIERIQDLLPAFLHLKDAVLRERNIEAFHEAWRVEELIRSVTSGQPVK